MENAATENKFKKTIMRCFYKYIPYNIEQHNYIFIIRQDNGVYFPTPTRKISR